MMTSAGSDASPVRVEEMKGCIRPEQIVHSLFQFAWQQVVSHFSGRWRTTLVANVGIGLVVCSRQ